MKMMFFNQRHFRCIIRTYGRLNRRLESPTHTRSETLRSSTATMCSTPNFIEIERKFIIPGNCEEKLGELDAKLMRKISFRDVYYDTDQLRLMLNDYWLRRRDGQWELKCPVSETRSITEQYAEYNQCTDILDQLRDVLVERQQQPTAGMNKSEPTPTQGTKMPNLPLSGSNGEELLANFLAMENCHPIAEFGTERTKYKINSDVTIDLDIADFGYCLGEIEILVPIGLSTDEAVNRIECIASQLGVNSDQKLSGKIIVYLKKHRPELYTMLANRFNL